MSLPGAKPPKPALGWREWVGLPDLGVDAVKAKVDTGAKTSAVHAWDLTEATGPDGIPVIRFTLHPVQRDDTVAVAAEAPLVEWREVRSSNGDAERRPVIPATVVVAGYRFAIELTLSRRDQMGFRMLLGRSALRRRFVVDPGASYRGGGNRTRPPPPPGQDDAVAGS